MFQNAQFLTVQDNIAVTTGLLDDLGRNPINIQVNEENVGNAGLNVEITAAVTGFVEISTEVTNELSFFIGTASNSSIGDLDACILEKNTRFFKGLRPPNGFSSGQINETSSTVCSSIEFSDASVTNIQNAFNDITFTFGDSEDIILEITDLETNVTETFVIFTELNPAISLALLAIVALCCGPCLCILILKYSFYGYEGEYRYGTPMKYAGVTMFLCCCCPGLVQFLALKCPNNSWFAHIKKRKKDKQQIQQGILPK